MNEEFEFDTPYGSVVVKANIDGEFSAPSWDEYWGGDPGESPTIEIISVNWSESLSEFEDERTMIRYLEDLIYENLNNKQAESYYADYQPDDDYEYNDKDYDDFF